MTDRPNVTLPPTMKPASALLSGATLAVLGTLVLAVSAKVQVPFYPVPMTLQTLAVLTLGALFGARLAAATLTLYLAEGLVGLPVFAGAVAGPAYMVGPTGGYLLGFLLAAALVGGLAERGWMRNWLLAVAAMALGISFCSPPDSPGWRCRSAPTRPGRLALRHSMRRRWPKPCSPPRWRSPRAALRRAAASAERRSTLRSARRRGRANLFRSDRQAILVGRAFVGPAP